VILRGIWRREVQYKGTEEGWGEDKPLLRPTVSRTHCGSVLLDSSKVCLGLEFRKDERWIIVCEWVKNEHNATVDMVMWHDAEDDIATWVRARGTDGVRRGQQLAAHRHQVVMR